MNEHLYQQKSLAWKILDRQSQYETIRQPYDDLMAEIINFTDPGLSSWTDVDGSKYRGKKIYEGTAPWALRVMADGWIGSLISEALSQWFKYLFPEPSMRGVDEVNEWIQQLEDYERSVYRSSKVYAAMGPFSRCGLSVGSSVVMPWESEDGTIDCDVPHPKENYHGPLDSYHRKYKIDVATAVKRFMRGKVPTDPEGMLSAPLSYELIKDWLDGRHAKRYEFVKAIYRSDDPILDSEAAKYKGKPWMEFYVQKPKPGDANDNLDAKRLLQTEEGGYFTKPHIKWDYEINTDEYYARTPASMAIHDIKTHNEFERLGMEAAQRHQQPPMWLMRKYRNQWTGYPGSKIYYDNADEAVAKPEAIYDGTNWEVGKEQADRIRRSVERWFQTDYFQLVTQLTATNKGAWPTLGQLIKLEGEKAVILAPRVGRFTTVLRELDNRIFDIQLRKGALPEPPPIVQDYFGNQAAMGNDKVDIQVEFIGPLTGIQQRSETLGRSEEGLQIIKSYVELDRMLTKKVRLSVQLEKDLENIRWSQDAITPEDEYNEILADEAEAAAEERALEMAGGAAKAAQGVSGPVDESSILAKIGAAA